MTRRQNVATRQIFDHFGRLDELPLAAADGLFLAAMRAVEPTFAGGEISEHDP